MRKETNLLWLSFLFRTLDQTPGKQAINEIRRFPHNLRALYDSKLERIKKLDQERKQACLEILMAVSLVYSLPIHLDTLAIVLGYDENHNLYKYVEKCNSFLVRTYSHEQDEHEINIIHNTAREWLEGNRGELLSEKMQGHADIAKNSVKAMSRLKAIDIERWNTSDIMRWTSESNGIDPPLCYGVPYSIQYSGLFWLYHLRDAMKTNPENVKELCDIGLGFSREYSSQWLCWLKLLSRDLWVRGSSNASEPYLEARRPIEVVQIYTAEFQAGINTLIQEFPFDACFVLAGKRFEFEERTAPELPLPPKISYTSGYWWVIRAASFNPAFYGGKH
ncbi:Vegetative incompatibility protein HET-E-1 [Metarhizium anisopliae]